MVVPFFAFITKEITTKCSLAYDDKDFKETVDAFVAGEASLQVSLAVTHSEAGKFEGLEKMVSSRIHLDDVVARGFEELVHKKDDHIKILVTPDRSKV